MAYTPKDNPLLNNRLVPERSSLSGSGSQDHNPNASPAGHEAPKPPSPFSGRDYSKPKNQNGLFADRERITARELKIKIEDKHLSQGIRKELAHEMHIANPYDPRVNAEIEALQEAVKKADRNRDGSVTRREL